MMRLPKASSESLEEYTVAECGGEPVSVDHRLLHIALMTTLAEPLRTAIGDACPTSPYQPDRIDTRVYRPRGRTVACSPALQPSRHSCWRRVPVFRVGGMHGASPGWARNAYATGLFSAEFPQPVGGAHFAQRLAERDLGVRVFPVLLEDAGKFGFHVPRLMGEAVGHGEHG